MNEIERKAKNYARRYYGELKKAGLATWKFEEFYSFCRPHAIKVVTSASRPVREPASVAAARISDAVSEAFEARFGKPLSGEAKNQVFLVAQKSVIASHRSKLRLS